MPHYKKTSFQLISPDALINQESVHQGILIHDNFSQKKVIVISIMIMHIPQSQELIYNYDNCLLCGIVGTHQIEITSSH